LKVSTLMSLVLSDASLKIAVFTLVVMTVSSKYCPVLSLVAVEAQPIATAIVAAARIALMRLIAFMLVFSG
jgi:hypothetical protein